MFEHAQHFFPHLSSNKSLPLSPIHTRRNKSDCDVPTASDGCITHTSRFSLDDGLPMMVHEVGLPTKQLQRLAAPIKREHSIACSVAWCQFANDLVQADNTTEEHHVAKLITNRSRFDADASTSLISRAS